MPRSKTFFPLDSVQRMLEGRDDVVITTDALIAESDSARAINGCQLRRVWSQTTRGDAGAGFQPVTEEHWHYYGQAFQVMVKRTKGNGALVATLAKLYTKLESRGCWLILIDPAAPLDAVIDRLGPIPAEWPEYVRRQFQPSRPSVRQPPTLG